MYIIVSETLNSKGFEPTLSAVCHLQWHYVAYASQATSALQLHFVLYGKQGDGFSLLEVQWTTLVRCASLTAKFLLAYITISSTDKIGLKKKIQRQHPPQVFKAYDYTKHEWSGCAVIFCICK